MMKRLGLIRRLDRAWLAIAGLVALACLPPAEIHAANTAGPYTALPTTLMFGTQAVGTSSTAQAITVTNNGTIALPITSITRSGTNPGQFTETNNCRPSVGVGATCTINIVFKPTAREALAATLNVNAGGGAGTQTVALSGTGIPGPYQVSPSALMFGTQAVGTPSTAQAVTVTNNGTIALPITGITRSGANAGQFSETNNCRPSVGIGATCTINVVFSPTVKGSKTATLNVNAGGGAGTQTVALSGTGTIAKVQVTTYHNNALRTGWNAAETSLTSSVVGGAGFGLLHQVTLDDQVDAQPLIVTGLTIAGGTHDVVYVATEGNTIYAIDASSGAILLSTNLGTPVPMSQLPGACNNNGNNIGINSTPVIDLGSQTLYVIAYIYPSAGAQKFMVHALSLTTLADKVTPVAVTAAHTLSNGTTAYDFTAASSRQRPALVEASGNIYAGFGSFCDINANLSRGWLLGWNASTLAPVAPAQLNNQVLPSNSPNDFFLTSIWMSGYGPAWDGGNNLFFVTGNSDYSGTTYDNTDAVNLSESVVAWSTSANDVVSYFSPTDYPADVATLDEYDGDFGAGGVMLLPTQPGSFPLLAVAAGKAGNMYLMNQTSLGGQNSAAVLGEYGMGSCWCGPSYFQGSDGVGRVVSSGGSNIYVWKVQTAPTTALVADPAFTSPSISTGQNPGFFTSVSSNGTTAGSAVIWAVNRPIASPYDVSLYAFDAATGAQLYSAVAGTWPNTNGDANIVPTVANGKVYVAAYGTLDIFGVEAPGQTLVSNSEIVRPSPPPEPVLSAHQISGFIRSSAGARVVIELRDGKRVTADLSEATRRHTAVQAVVGEPVLVRGDYDPNGVLQADSFLHAKPQPALWRPDR
ncbi:MAG: choice-of-anchor D domain-containing protein [Steroidobacteraceae bacterium]